MFSEKLIIFSETVGKLKSLKRSGWISHAEITDPESVADHSYRCAILAMCIGDLLKIDTEKLIKMLLLHDIQETITGDYNSYVKKKMGVSKVKFQEKAAIKDVLSVLPTELKNQYIPIWEEYEKQKTYEARLANDIDKIEMMMQALEYEKGGHDSQKFETFWIRTQKRIKTPVIRSLFDMLKNRRMT
jgi:putative hydrolase of HD superfamily